MQSNGVAVLASKLDRTEWTRVLGDFKDANLYQTWEYGCHRYGNEGISTLLVSEGGSPVSAALLRLVRVPFLDRGIAYVRWGPLWRRTGCTASADSFARGIRALREEYVDRRGFVLRLRPYLFANEGDTAFDEILRSEGYTPVSWRSKERTLLVDLRKPIEDLRKGLSPKWRNHLNGAERKDLNIIEGTGDHQLEPFGGIYRDLLQRKQFSEARDIDEFRRIQRDLPEKLKMRVFLCESEGSVCAGIVCSAIGSTGVTLLRATNPLGRRCKAAYLIQWRALQWLKDVGCSHYDLSGINPELNPGTYAYKAGLCGKNGRDLLFLPQFEAYPGGVSRTVLPTIEKAFLALRRLPGRLRRVAGRTNS